MGAFHQPGLFELSESPLDRIFGPNHADRASGPEPRATQFGGLHPQTPLLCREAFFESPHVGYPSCPIPLREGSMALVNEAVRNMASTSPMTLHAASIQHARMVA